MEEQLGVFGKIRTQFKVANAIIPIQADSPWNFESRDAVESRLRDAACRAARPGTQSATTRGRTHALVAALRTYPSSAWYKATSSGGSVALGVDAADGPMHDWVVTAELVQDPTSGRVLQVATPEYLTENGALANGSRHNEARRALDDLEDSCAAICGKDEAKAAIAGLTEVQEAPSKGYDLDPQPELTVSTKLTLDQISAAFRSVPLPFLSRSDSSWTWALVLLAPSEENTVTASVSDQGNERVVRVTCKLQRTGDQLIDGILSRMRFLGPPYVTAPIKWLEENSDA